ncbi:peptidoglycan D,D-transpeptidase FtsI family protein [Sphingomonas sp.]|uniref:peptidoglycan D,D-transpeptidase FtsI family protein n=1 Tax=Sphingomonas sp. TaxID=28214 RepID=UPI003B008C8D
MGTVLVARPAPSRRAQARGQLVALAHMRLMMLMLLFAAAVTLVIGRLAMLAAFGGAEARATVATLAARGDIVDRNGQPLARTIASWTIAVHPRALMGDKQAIAARLAALMPERGEAWFYQQLTKDVSFTYLERRASPQLVEQVNALGEPAIVFARETQRLYPQSSLAAHALGFLSPDGHGMSGMERVLDTQLLDPRTNGQPVALSIDTRVQAAMESELSRAKTTYQARAAAGLVLDVHTGEVIAMVSLPTFNPNRVGMSGADELRNATTQNVYELGSTFKPITMAAAIETGTVTDMSRRFDATAPLHVGGFTIHDAAGDPARWLNIPETLIYSSNVATARIADLMGRERLEPMFRKMGFDTKPDIELRERGRPLWPRYWARTTTMTTAYGHGIAITPLQLANAYATLVNGGMWRPTTLLKVGPGHQAPAGRRVISEATSARMRQLLRLIVLRGTGRSAEAPGYRVGGKTGSAEAASMGGYDRSRNVATFVGVFPIDQPRYVVLSMLDSPIGTKETGGWKTAAWNAAPVVGRVVSRVGAMLGVTPDDNRDIDESDLIPFLWEEPGARQAAAR